MNQRRSCAFNIVFALTLYSVTAGAEYDPKFDPGAVTPWRESETTLPAYPADPDLVEVPASAIDGFTLYIDRKSLSRGDDRVVRLTTVIASPTGARNVFYEGIRCDTREFKIYATGSSERQWRAFAAAQWQFIAAQERNGFRYQLYRHYVCDAAGIARVPADILRAVADIARPN